MKRKVIELEIIDEIEESGVSAISLVDSPAINIEWMAFKEEKFVKPQGGESEDEFVSRCIGVLVGDEGYEQDQAAAICYSTWRENMSYDISSLPPYVDEQPKKKKFAAVEDLKVGDAVSWTTGGQNPRGKIKEIVREGSKKIPGADFEVTGSPEDPGYVIEIYEEVEGEWKPTGKVVGRKADSILKNVQLNEQFGQNPTSDRKDETTRTSKQTPDVSRPAGYSRYFSADQTSATRRYFIQEDQRIIVGPAMIPNMEIVRQDENSKEVYYVKFSEETVAKIAEKFMRELRNKNTNVLHQEDLPADTYIMETWLVETEDDKAKTKYGFEVPIGTWMVKMRVTNPKVWKLVKEGRLKGLSIEGSFIDKTEIEDYERSKILKKIIEILSQD
jgi:hypothetical protein